jgi:hypothetical protein
VRPVQAKPYQTGWASIPGYTVGADFLKAGAQPTYRSISGLKERLGDLAKSQKLFSVHVWLDPEESWADLLRIDGDAIPCAPRFHSSSSNP